MGSSWWCIDNAHVTWPGLVSAAHTQKVLETLDSCCDLGLAFTPGLGKYSVKHRGVFRVLLLLAFLAFSPLVVWAVF